MQQLSLLDLAEAAKRTPAPLVAVAALGEIVEPALFEQILERGLELVEVETATGTRLYVAADELVAHLIGPLFEAAAPPRVN